MPRIEAAGVEAIRRFNRFYTRRIGVLRRGHLGSPYSLPEARVLYELAQGGRLTATVLGKELDLDLGYLSRLLQGLGRRGLVEAKPSSEDARRSLLSLTAKGRKAFASLDHGSRREMGAMLAPLSPVERTRLVDAMSIVQSLLHGEKKKSELILRPHRPGDMGWVVHRHGVLYDEEYGWGERFEGLVAGIAAKFIENFDRQRERCWIAELDGDPVGSVLVVKESATAAKLRLLLVEPKARGRGLGKRLVEECIAFARGAGYRRLVLWTQSNLVRAREIYAGLGFRLVKKEPHRQFGIAVVGEYWDLKL